MEFVPFGAADKIKLTVALIQSTVCIPTKSGKVCTARDAVRFMMLCQAQRLNPYAGDCYLCGYDGKNGPVFSLITAHQAFLKRAETCKDYEGMESGVIICGENNVCTEREGDFVTESENCVGGWARVFRAGRKPTYRRLSIAAMMPPYETPFWSKLKAPSQIVKCAEADALRATFPTLLGGLYSGQELDMGATVSSSGVADIPTPKPLFQPPAEETRELAAPEPEPAEKSAQPETAQENGDKMRAAMESKGQPSPQAELESKLATDNGVSFEDFTSFVVTKNIGGKNIAKDADSWPSWSEVSTEVCEAFAAQPKAMEELIRKFGSKKA